MKQDKVLATRLNKVILNLIHADQTGFMPGTSTSENIQRALCMALPVLFLYYIVGQFQILRSWFLEELLPYSEAHLVHVLHITLPAVRN